MSGIGHVEVGSADLDRSLAFYEGVLGLRPAGERTGAAVWLDAGPARLKLVDARGGDLGGWSANNLQRGIRHVGLKVGSVDAWARRLRDAGVEFTLEPTDAVGDVRIAFFPDPDGTNLEIIQGHVHYHTVVSAELAERERAAAERRPATAGPVFDHVAVTVEDLDAALARYRDTLGFEVIGELDLAPHPDGFRITYLQAGAVVLELFSFTAPTLPGPRTPPESRLGLRSVGLAGGTLTV
jgi:catechol 2,3-dioxygenase-like lactoylglutathione lyase family enzyme